MINKLKIFQRILRAGLYLLVILLNLPQARATKIPADLIVYGDYLVIDRGGAGENCDQIVIEGGLEILAGEK